MWSRKIIYLLIIPLFCSCTEQWEGDNSAPGKVLTKSSMVTFTVGNEDISLYIFREQEGVFRYDSTVNIPAMNGGKKSVRLALGRYKFFFASLLGKYMDFHPFPLDSETTLDQLQYISRVDPENEGCILPADEVYLPEPSEIDSIYVIRGGEEIKSKLKRRVAQFSFVLKRGYEKGGKYVSLPFAEGQNILDNFQKMEVRIADVGEIIDYKGVYGKGVISESYTVETCDSLDREGYAYFTGPFVVPPVSSSATLSFSLLPVDKYGGVAAKMEKKLTVPLERNEHLQVTLWINGNWQDIIVTIDRRPISEMAAGDSGIWE